MYVYHISYITYHISYIPLSHSLIKSISHFAITLIQIEIVSNTQFVIDIYIPLNLYPISN